jgi:hypothetical protein
MIGYYPIQTAGSASDEDAFGPRFFRTHFFDRMKSFCEVDDHTPVLEIILTSGQVLDVANIVELTPQYMLVSAFVDSRDCEVTYHAYIRYITIYRINLLSRPRGERPIGFTPHEPQEVPAEVPVEAKAKRDSASA